MFDVFLTSFDLAIFILSYNYTFLSFRLLMYDTLTIPIKKKVGSMKKKIYILYINNKMK